MVDGDEIGIDMMRRGWGVDGRDSEIFTCW